MSVLKIELDTPDVLAILQREGDEAFIEVKNRIVQEFTKRYLKDIANTEVVEKAKTSIVSIIREEIQKEIGSANTWGSGISDAIKTKIREFVSKEITATVELIVKQEFHRFEQNTLTRFVESEIERLSKYNVTKMVQERMNQIVKEVNANINSA